MDLNIIRDRWRSGEFEAIVAIVDHNRMARFFGEESSLGFRHERTARLLEAAGATVNPARRDSLFRELIAIFREEQPARSSSPWSTRSSPTAVSGVSPVRTACSSSGRPSTCGSKSEWIEE